MKDPLRADVPTSADHPRRPDGVVLRRLTRSDCVVTADLQVRHLGDGLFPRLGRRFVTRWHETFVDGDDTSGHLALRGEEVLGFVIAATDQRAYVTQTLRTARTSLVSRGLLAMLIRPRVAWLFVRTRAKAYWKRLRRPVATAPAGQCTAVVHAIVTVPAARGAGVGRRLLDAVEADVRATGTQVIELLSEDGEDGEHGGADFYRRLGWTEGASFVNRDGRRMARFSRQVAP